MPFRFHPTNLLQIRTIEGALLVIGKLRNLLPLRLQLQILPLTFSLLLLVCDNSWLPEASSLAQLAQPDRAQVVVDLLDMLWVRLILRSILFSQSSSPLF